MIEPVASCDTCAFFLASDDTDVEAVGVCRRYPPVKTTGEDLALFPFIWDWAVWCGEWKEKDL